MRDKKVYLPAGENRDLVVDKERVARTFSASIDTYERCATVQTMLADCLVQQIVDYGTEFRSGLEIGCGTGYLGRELAARIAFDSFYLNDLSPELCRYAVERFADRCPARILAGDIEVLDLPPSLDLVVSSSTFQWLEDLERLFIKIAAVLEKEGLFAFSLFGRGTMAEIAALSGRSLNYTDFIAVSQLLSRYFSVVWEKSVEHTLFFPSVLAVFKHIRNTGVGGLGQTRWTRAGLKIFEKEYRRQFGTEKGLPVSYCAYIFLATSKK